MHCSIFGNEVNVRRIDRQDKGKAEHPEDLISAAPGSVFHLSFLRGELQLSYSSSNECSKAQVHSWSRV